MKQNVLFLCTGNSCRSQMAEGWARHFHPNIFKACSAGITAQGLNPLAVKAMAEAGVDISSQYSKTIEDLVGLEFDFVITVCDQAHESCPFFSGKTEIIHAGFEDPPRLAAGAATKDEALFHYHRIRDEIRTFAENLPDRLKEMPEL